MGKTWEWFVRVFGSENVLDRSQIPKHQLPRPHRGHNARDRPPPEPYKRSRSWLKNLFFPGEKSDDVVKRFDD
jgi:hypothetical protein